jgi:ABC-type uncharacterized transport system involved in gliding motility auxiliary subunit
MTGIAALLAGLGVVAFGFGILSALLLLFQPFFNPAWIEANLAIGLVLLLVAVSMNLESLRDRIRSGGSRRAGKYGSSAILTAILSVVLLGFLGFLSTRYAHRFDVSEAGVHTLSAQTTELLKGLDQDVSIVAFFAASEAPPVHDLLDRYAFASDRIDLRFVDPNDVPGMVDELGLTTDELSKGVVRISLASGEATTLSEFTESAVTNALRKLVKSSGKKIYFLEGHNERAIEPTPGEEDKGEFASGPDSYGRAATALVNETYQVAPLLLATEADVPADAAAVIIAGPTRLFLPEELAALERYVDRGGSLFVAIDPRAQTNLYELLKTWGIVLGDDVVVDRALAVFGQATTPLAGEYDGKHPITSQMREPTLFPMVRSVEIDPAAKGDFSTIVKTGRDSWAERDLDGWRKTGRAQLGPEDLEGPVPIAVAGNPEIAGANGAPPKTGGRIVVFGDSDFATNADLDALRNRDLFVNSINWLVGDVEQITVRPHVSRASSFKMTQDQFRRIQYISLFVLPEAIAVFGVFVWWVRRRTPGR